MARVSGSFWGEKSHLGGFSCKLQGKFGVNLKEEECRAGNEGRAQLCILSFWVQFVFALSIVKIGRAHV